MQKDKRAESMLVLTTLIWGGTFPVIQWALKDISPMLMVGIRFILAGLLAWPVLVPPKRTISETPQTPSQPRFNLSVLVWGLVIGLGMLAGYAGQTIGLQYTTVPRSGFITYTFALFVPFLQFFMLGRRPKIGNLLGLFVVFWGLSFVTETSSAPLRLADFHPGRIITVTRGLLGGGLNKGDLFSLAGAVGYAFYIVLLDKATKICHPGAVTVVQMLACGAFALILSPFVETPRLVPTLNLAGSIIYLAVFGGVIALALMNWFQRHLNPLRAVLIYSLEPIFASILAWVLMGTIMTGREIVGAFFILSGILVSDLWEFLAKPPKKKPFGR